LISPKPPKTSLASMNGRSVAVIAAPRALRASAPFSEQVAAERIVQSLSCGTAPALMCPAP
jgi:hypothetical protein